MKTIPALLFLGSLSSLGAMPPANLQAQLDTWSHDLPGGIAVTWVDADGVALAQSGKFSADDSRALAADTRFEIGSVTKVFTALLLAESERAGKVSRNDPAAKFLLPAGDPDQAKLAPITLLSLTTHSSGLPRLPANIGTNPDAAPNPYARYDHAALVEALRLHGPTAPVGRAVNYSNFGVGVLGEALGAAWGTSYAAALTAHVLAPLKLTATSLALTDSSLPAELAPGHAAGARVPTWTFQAEAPAGAIISTPRDLGVFLEFCLGRTDAPLKAALAEALKPQRDATDVGGRIGFGWFIGGENDRPVYWHNGATNGYHAFIAFCPAAGRGVALLANDAKSCDALGFSLIGMKPPAPAAEKLPNAADYPGRYPLSSAFAIDITEHNGALALQATGQPRLALRKVADDRFAVAGAPAEISFERDGDGKINALVLHQNGRDLRGARGELPPPPKEIALPAGTLRAYAGAYALTPQFVITITEAGGALFAQATGQAKAPIFAAAKDEFFYKIVDARISFERDAAGQVIALTLHQGGRDSRATKRE
jgi:CubicO group peptidase (beta-lactamase class C family)